MAAPKVSFNDRESILCCRRITRQANSSFPIAFQLLAPAKRRAMEALYAFMRVSDDLADEPGEIQAKWQRLHAWRAGLLASLQGRFSHPIHPALYQTVRRFEIPPGLLIDALDGVESDLEPKRFATFADLYPYCYRVASAVGLACVRIWGYRPGLSENDRRSASAAAEAAGIAFQLTNILRDLKEDFDRGRVYLPLDELTHFGITPGQWHCKTRTATFREFMDFQTARANHYYRKAEALNQFLATDGRAIFQVMTGMYLSLLKEIEKRTAEILFQRIRVRGWRKGLILLDGWAIKLGFK